MAERIRSTGFQSFEATGQMVVVVDKEKTPVPVIHEFQPVTGRLGIVAQSTFSAATFEFLSEHGKIGENDAETLERVDGIVKVTWSQPKIMEYDEEKDTVRDPRGLVRPQFITVLQTRYPSLMSEWSDAQALAGMEGEKWKPPTDLELANAVLNNHKPL